MEQQRPDTRRIFLTGPPGVGKTSVIVRLEEYCNNRGLRVGGLITQEVRDAGTRTGFRLRDIHSGTEGWLAKRGTGVGPRIGSYTVVSDDLDRIGKEALETSTGEDVDIALVDEIGPMEMTSAIFRRALSELVNSKKTLVATVKQGSHYKEVENALKETGTVLMEITRENRHSVLEQIISRISSQTAAKGQGSH